MKNNLEINDKQNKIIEAALELLNEKGYNELSLRDIAKKLDVKAPAIYWHFKNKAMLLDYMAEYILQKELGDFEPRKDEQTWQDWLTYNINLFRKAMLSYRDGGRVVAGAHLFPAVTLAKLLEYSLISLCSSGMDIKTATSVMITSIRYTFGYVIEEQSDKYSDKAPEDNILSSGNFPNLMEVMKIGDTEDTAFKLGLELIIVGGSEVMSKKTIIETI
ncbi:TetR family transcriptional regulator [Clostridium beijerinckii]|uniref:TetR/AcrR family tetracycline transcriptional repressor n=1 Tax=Clostridium beijerinckii TaxID=1520 RepID=A0A9Q5GE49_CLOBE|nr:TetR/AcrR family transcriptional regulator C-terminal domain-containing protein [Clostridium beijerinckii]AQS05868.1 tetracycline repressor protein class H [Clostridium beijerinckii]MBA2888621.1 TetR/AcrR family tetracycline transcriptional repressor [Clostridium beijerinckii]MBA2900000.1 TetR/AcrR family tetracycline transcriptional repressor [Clostridium beijerinckii]MBA2909629.1 TetR/AcrR family tetracycline transcriptional repressor [Clostridium beijerinckii]MBA9014534.1 TetR/AcrR famil